jgi:hypothetical protein
MGFSDDMSARRVLGWVKGDFSCPPSRCSPAMRNSDAPTADAYDGFKRITGAVESSAAVLLEMSCRLLTFCADRRLGILSFYFN